MLVLVRHAQASFGATEYDRLSALGVEQAALTAAYLKTREGRRPEVAVGPRARHRSTAAPLVAALELATHRYWDDADLDEFTGTAGMRAPEDRSLAARTPGQALARLLSRIGAWAEGELVLEGCPTLPVFRERVGRWLRRELSAIQPRSVRYAITSGGVVAAAVCEVMDLPNRMFLPLVTQVRNASLTEFGNFQGVPVLVSFNGTSHLPTEMWTSI